MFKVLCQVKSLAEHVEIKYIFIHSLEEPGQGWDTYPENYMAGVTWVWEQVSEAFPAVRAEFNRRLPTGVQRIRFPAFTAGMIWPFAAPDRRASKRQLYLYGDAIAARLGSRLAGQNLSDTEIFDQYMELSCQRMRAVERYRELEFDAWQRRDIASDISIFDFLTENIERLQLFVEPGRVTEHLVRYTLRKLIEATFNPSHDYISALERLLQFYVGYDNISLPIHPLVAERLKLNWFEPDATYRWFAHDWTFMDWIVRCVRLSPYVEKLY